MHYKQFLKVHGVSICIILILVSILMCMFLPTYSKEKIFKKDLECLQASRSVEPLKDDIKVAFYSPSRNTCIYIISWANVAIAYDLSNRVTALDKHCNNGDKSSICEGSVDEFIARIKNIYK